MIIFYFLMTLLDHCFDLNFDPQRRDFSFLSPQLAKEEEKKRGKRSLIDEEVKEEKQKQTEKTLPVLHLQGQRKKYYTLVQASSSVAHAHIFLVCQIFCHVSDV